MAVTGAYDKIENRLGEGGEWRGDDYFMKCRRRILQR